MKADLITALIGRDSARAAAEIDEMARICAAAQADIRLVTGPGGRLSLAAEAAAAQQLLALAGIEVSADVPDQVLPAGADDVLAPVPREAVTNILRHSKATACMIELTAGDGIRRLRVGNDGAGEHADATAWATASEGRGLLNMAARVGAAGGHLAADAAGGRFDLTAAIPVDGARLRAAEPPYSLDPSRA